MFGERKILLYLLMATEVLLVVNTQRSGRPRDHHTYLAYKATGDGVMVSVRGTFVSDVDFWLQLWRPIDGSPRRLRLIFEKLVRADMISGDTELTFSFKGRGSENMNKCPIVLENDCIGLYATRDPFPVDYDREVFRDIYEDKFADRPRVGDSNLFEGTFIHPFRLEGQMRPLKLEEVQQSPESATFVECGTLSNTPVTTTIPAVTIPAVTTETGPTTTLTDVTTMTDGANNTSPGVLDPKEISISETMAMPLGVGISAGVVVVTIIIIIVVCCLKQKRNSAKDMEKPRPIVTAPSEFSVSSDMRSTTNQAYGIDMDFLHPNTYQTMDDKTKRPISTHDYSPIILPRDVKSTARTTPEPSPKPPRENGEHSGGGSKVAHLKQTLGVALPGLSPQKSPALPPKPKPTVNATYLDLSAGMNDYIAPGENSYDRTTPTRQDSQGYEQMPL